jgi:hypothetical protein
MARDSLNNNPWRHTRRYDCRRRPASRGCCPTNPRHTLLLGDVVLNIDRLRLVILGDIYKPLLFLGIRSGLGLTLGTRGFTRRSSTGASISLAMPHEQMSV